MMKKYLPIALVAIALVVIIPTVYAITQPSVIINLESGQTPLGARPFVIEDDLGNEVFSVSPSGNMRTTNEFTFEYKQAELVVLPVGLFESPLLKELAVWEFVQDPSFSAKLNDFPQLVFFNSVSNAVAKPLNTTCGCVRTGWFSSANTTFSETGMHWVFEQATVSPTTFVNEFDGVFSYHFDQDAFGSITSNPNFYAYGIQNQVTDKTGEVKEMSGSVTIHLPIGVSVVRVK